MSGLRWQQELLDLFGIKIKPPCDAVIVEWPSSDIQHRNRVGVAGVCARSCPLIQVLGAFQPIPLTNLIKTAGNGKIEKSFETVLENENVWEEVGSRILQYRRSPRQNIQRTVSQDTRREMVSNGSLKVDKLVS